MLISVKRLKGRQLYTDDVIYQYQSVRPPGWGNVFSLLPLQLVLGGFSFVIPMSRITSSAFFAPAKAAAWIGKWPSLFCLQSFAPCFSFGRKEMSGEKDKQTILVQKQSWNELIICSVQLDCYLPQVNSGPGWARDANFDPTSMVSASQLFMEQARMMGVLPRSPWRLLSVLL